MADDLPGLPLSPQPLTPVDPAQPTQLLTMVRLRERHSDLMREYGAFDDEPTPEFITRIIAFQTDARAAGVGISSSDERFEAQSKINYWQTARINAGQRPDTVLLAAFDQAAAKDAAGNRSPYKGLAPFLTGDSKFFAGRYELVGKLVANVKKVRLLALLGLSGSGKSSAIRAGLIPDLKDGAYDGIDDDGLTKSSLWQYPDPILPGADPLKALEDVYGTIAAAADLPAALDRLGSEVVLSIDQFEEVFTLSDENDPQIKARRELFLDALVAAATTGKYRHVVVITMRSEYDSYVAKYSAFTALFSAGREVIQAMQASDLRKVIEEPANRLGVGFEPGLVDELMTKVQGEPAGLPLLSFTLLKLWEMRADGQMKMADYVTLGGNPREILANSATQVYLKFPNEDRVRTQDIFTRLVKIGDSLEATSQRTTRADLDVLGARDNINHVLDVLIDKGLLRSSPPPVRAAATDVPASDDALLGLWITDKTQFEVAHEALIRNWGLLTDWVKDSFAKQTNRKAFALRAQNWKDKKGDLLSGLSLDEAKNFPDRSLVEVEYIAASQLHEQAQQRKQLLVTAAFAVMALLLAVALVRLIMIGREREAGRHSGALFAAAEALVDRGEVPLARKVLRESVDAADPQPAPVRAVLSAVAPLVNSIRPGSVASGETLPPRVQALLQAVALNNLGPRPPLRIGGTAQPTDVRIDDGITLLSLWDDGIARVWIQGEGDTDFVNPPLELSVPGREITAIALSPDGDTAVTGSRDAESAFGDMYLDFWTFDSSDVAAQPHRVSKRWGEAYRGIVTSIKYYPNDPNKQNNAIILVATDGGESMEVDTRKKSVKSYVRRRSDGEAVAMAASAYSPRGDKILTAVTDGSITIVDATTHEANPYLNPVERSTSRVTAATFNPTGERFAIGSEDGIIRVYRTSDNQKLYELVGHGKGITGLAFSPDGATLVSSSKDGTLRFWDFGVEAGRLRRTLQISDAAGRTAPVTGVAYTEDGERIVAASGAGAIHILDVNGNKIKSKIPIGSGTEYFRSAGFAISADRSAMVTNADIGDGKTKATKSKYELFDLKTGKRRAAWDAEDASQFYGVQLSTDGAILAAVQVESESNGWDATIKTLTPLAKPIMPVARFNDPPALLVLAPDGNTIILVDTYGVITMHESKEWPKVTALAQFKQRGYLPGPTFLTSFSERGRLFALSYLADPRIFVYDLDTRRIIATIPSAAVVSTLEFSRDGTTLFIGTKAGSGAIYGARAGKLVRRLAGSHDGSITYARFSNTGTTLVTGSTDATARLWNVGTGEKLQILRGHTATVSGASFSKNGDRLLTESDDRTVRLWDIKTGRQLTILRGAASSGALWGWFADDGTVQTVSESPAELRTWKVTVPIYHYDDLRALACKDNRGKITEEERERNSLPPELPAPKCAAAAGAK